MVYTFSCPLPCDKSIKVNASCDDDAIKKIITAGAINCRNELNRSCSEKHTYCLPPLKEKHLQEIVKLSMKTE
jgi:hypothetical protein